MIWLQLMVSKLFKQHFPRTLWTKPRCWQTKFESDLPGNILVVDKYWNYMYDKWSHYMFEERFEDLLCHITWNYYNMQSGIAGEVITYNKFKEMWFWLTWFVSHAVLQTEKRELTGSRTNESLLQYTAHTMVPLISNGSFSINTATL